MGAAREEADAPRVRAARDSDLEHLVHIYNHYVAHTHSTFDVQPLTLEERRPWIAQFSRTGPHRLLVAEIGDDVVGYASSTTFRGKPAYATSVETTVYLDPRFTGRRIGAVLYGRLLEILKSEPGVHRAVAGIALPNPASVALHERLEFVPVGTFHEIGLKFGRYWDVRWYERRLSQS